MTRRLRLTAYLSLAIAAPALAQVPESAPRAIPLPDALGANFPVSDTLTGTSGPTDYDFPTGTWRFTFQPRRADGSFDRGRTRILDHRTMQAHRVSR